MIILLDGAVLELDDETRMGHYQLIVDTLRPRSTTGRTLDLTGYEPALTPSSQGLAQRVRLS